LSSHHRRPVAAIIIKARILHDIPDGLPSAGAVGTGLCSGAFSGMEIVFAFGEGGAVFEGDLVIT